ncbi:CASP-like protein 1F2 [Magnolia sinica]|uniref:CASP-like protein 1F2 n=1 Tax=Magnolia sinica TaxID=86752 RepID=UPI00265B29C8|nr:CASP-like protein 1F2 [Magnolia sinica]
METDTVKVERNEIVKVERNPRQINNKTSVLAQILLRTIAFGATLAATLLIATSKQSIVLYGYPINAEYSYSPPFRFFLGANALVSGYSLLSMPFAFILSRQRTDLWGSYVMFLMDLMMMGLTIAASSAATSIGYLGRYGNSHIGWTAICDNFGKFCNKVGISVIFSFVAILPFIILTLIFAKPRQTRLATY